MPVFIMLLLLGFGIGQEPELPTDTEFERLDFDEAIVAEPESRGYWYLRGESMLLRRRRMDDRGFVFSTANNARLLDTVAWTTPTELAGRFTLGRQVTDQTAVEFVGWFEDDFEDYALVTGTPGTMRQPFFNHDFYAPRPRIGEVPALVELAYQTQITSVEALVRHYFRPANVGVGRLGIVAGPRFFRLEEQFQDYDSLTAVRGANPADTIYETFVDNKLYGGVLGGMGELNLSRNLHLLLDFKFAGFANFTEATNRFATQDGAIQYFQASTPETWFSGITEIGFHLLARLTRRTELRAGYHAMYFWHTTSAPDVLSFNLLRQTKQNNELAFWVHGPTISLEFRF